MDKKLVLRDKFSKIYRHLSKQEITLILGARRVGKTTLLYQLKEKLLENKVLEKNIYFLNLDLVDDLMLLKSQSEFIDYIKERISSSKIYFFIDEVQRLENPGLFLKGIYDLNLPVKFILTGSSSLEIRAKTQESLAGRKRIFYLYPFSFREYLRVQNSFLVPRLLKEKLNKIDQNEINKYLSEFLIFGGYPEVVLLNSRQEKIKTLEEIFNSYIEKDIVGFFKIEDRVSFTKLVTILASQVGNLLNNNEISGTLGIKSETVKRYLQALENTFVINTIRPFYKNVRKELTKMPKVFFLDNGLRNFALKRFKKFNDCQDQGQILENYVFSFLKKTLETYQEIYFWRTKDRAEVDFIIEHEELMAIEVKASKLKKPIFGRSLGNFIRSYHPKKAFLINLAYQGRKTISQTKINFGQAWEMYRFLHG